MQAQPKKHRPQLEEDMYESTFIDSEFDDFEGTEFLSRSYIKEFIDDYNDGEMESAKFGHVSDYF